MKRKLQDDKNYRAGVRSIDKMLVQQATVHHTVVNMMAIEVNRMREALRDAIRLLDATRRNEWTPADSKRLEEIREVANG